MIRSHSLYPTELQAHAVFHLSAGFEQVSLRVGRHKV
jgi:hypothetical protein